MKAEYEGRIFIYDSFIGVISSLCLVCFCQFFSSMFFCIVLIIIIMIMIRIRIRITIIIIIMKNKLISELIYLKNLSCLQLSINTTNC